MVHRGPVLYTKSPATHSLYPCTLSASLPEVRWPGLVICLASVLGCLSSRHHHFHIPRHLLFGLPECCDRVISKASLPPLLPPVSS